MRRGVSVRRVKVFLTMTTGRRLLLLLLLLLLEGHLALETSICEPGLTGGLKGCTDIDECELDEDNPVMPCDEDALCRNTVGSFYCECKDGYNTSHGTTKFTPDTAVKCIDINECQQGVRGGGAVCPAHAVCYNALPGYTCVCEEGFTAPPGVEHVTVNDTCEDIDECEQPPCGPDSGCVNTPGSYACVCNRGFALRSGRTNYTGTTEKCEDVCERDQTLCGNGTCHHVQGGHVCTCRAGFSNYANERSRCTELRCELFQDAISRLEDSPDVQRVLTLLERSCWALSKSETPTDKINGEEFLKRLLSAIDRLLSSGAVDDNRKVSTLFGVVEAALGLISPFMGQFQTHASNTHTELEVLLLGGTVPPRGPLELLSNHTALSMQWETAAGKDSSYPGFTTVSLLTYTTLENSNTSSIAAGLRPRGLQINSKVVTVKVSNLETNDLQEDVKLTFRHLEEPKVANSTVCVYWDSLSGDGGGWSTEGFRVVHPDANHTTCSCNHLSTFAILMALHEIEEPFAMQVFTWVGLALSLICLFICILTFTLIRSIQSARNTIHLHLCLCLFAANLVFLCGISRTENQTGCAVVAGLLHYLYLAAFCWMCLEGVQLFRMVVMVFNTNFPLVRMMALGYGVPAVIVSVSALVNSSGYGTERHCWLNLEGGFMWSFFGPVCVIITVNIFFFLITMWKLAQKLSSLNPDLDNLHKIKAFTITAVAQLCVLGTMWIFGCFQFEGGSVAVSYLFTILNSLQGLLLFVLHCLLFKPVREEYGKLFSRLCTPQKKKYSEFTSSQSSKGQTSRTIQNTGESHI